MNRLTKILMLLALVVTGNLSAQTVSGQQIPVLIRKDVAIQLGKVWAEIEKPSKSIACLYGQILREEGQPDAVAIDSFNIVGVNPDSIEGCKTIPGITLLGAAGFIDGSTFPNAQYKYAVMDAMCNILDRQTTWYVAGEFYANVPFEVEGVEQQLPVILACSRNRLPDSHETD